MSLNNKKIESIEEKDLQALLDNEVPESKTIEYKSALPDNSDKGKKEFLADVSSFANTSGGHLIFGIKEKAGIPTELSGLEISDTDAKKLRLENTIMHGIEPRIPNISIRAIDVNAKSRKIIVIHISKSWISPHMVIFKKHTRFYSRHSAGKYPLDVSELRSAFALSETTAEHIRNFRQERLGLIVENETPIPLNNNPKIVLHIVPFESFNTRTNYDIASNITALRSSGCLEPICASSWHQRYNFDGYLTHNRDHTYLQIFRNGIIEAVEADMLREREIKGEKKLVIPHLSFEKELFKALDRYLSLQKQLGIEPPFIIMVSLLGVKGYRMGASTHMTTIMMDIQLRKIIL